MPEIIPPLPPVTPLEKEHKDKEFFAGEWISDDMAFLEDLLRRNWKLDAQEVPRFYSNEDWMTRDNVPGSIYIYDLGTPFDPSRMGIGFDNNKRTHNMGISLQVPNRRRAYIYVNHLINILWKYRKGFKHQLNGYDHIEIRNVSKKTGYTGFYEFTVEIKFVQEVKAILSDGFGDGLNIYADTLKTDKDIQEI